MKLICSATAPLEQEGPISLVAQPFVGEYEWLEDDAPFFDFASLTLEEDGTFHAMVDAKLVNPSVRTFGSTRCTLPESGVWNAYVVGDRTKIKLRPSTSRARVYEGSFEESFVVLTRRGGRVVLSALRAETLVTTALEVA
jgi:hypothetical protein